MAQEFAEGKDVIDLACGEGYGSALIAKKARTVVGVDNAPEVINAARGKYRETNLKFENASVTSLPFGDHTIDLVVSFETIEHVDDHEGMMEEIKRVLRPAGMLLISSPDKEHYSDIPGHENPFHVKELYFQEFKSLIKRYFSQVCFLSQRTVSGSLILNPGDLSEVTQYSGDYTKIAEARPFNGVYNLALASDQSLPAARSSYFDSARVIEQAISETERKLKSSWRYRVGNILLAPARWIMRRG
jgi:SAM-dependent methyltransferase